MESSNILSERSHKFDFNKSQYPPIPALEEINPNLKKWLKKDEK